MSKESIIKDINLAEEGLKRINWAEMHMPVLKRLREHFEKEKPFTDIKIGACMHITVETAVLLRTLKAGGAEIYISASNPLSTQDDVAAALVKEKIHVYGWRGETETDYYRMIDYVASSNPDIVIDDGGDLIVRLHEKFPSLASKVIGGCEETTTGVIREKALADAGKLLFPVIAVNDALTKRLMDNKYGTGQSAIDGILRATNVLFAGKNVVIAGYGYVGSGIARGARGLGARVIITEIDPIKALVAVLDGFTVMPMEEAAEIGDVFITATGNINVIRKEHLLKMKNGALLANAGHFNVEINLKDLEEISIEKKEVNSCITEYKLKNGKKLYLLGKGRLVNLVCAKGHSSEVMDVSFSLQALSIEYLLENEGKIKPGVYTVPLEIDTKVAKLKLNAMGIQIDVLTPEQEEYLKKW